MNRALSKPVLWRAEKPFLWTDASDLKTINILFSKATIGCGTWNKNEGPNFKIILTVVNEAKS